jgi:glycosyltransferase involved in cell wall biosynthesis
MIVHIDCGKGWRGGQSQALYLTEGLKKKGFDVSLICQAGSPLWQKAMDAGIEVYPLKMNFEFDPASAFKISKILKKKEAQILHFHDSHSATLGILASFLYPVPIKISARKVDFSVRGNPFRKLKYDKLVSAVIAVSNGVKNVLIRDGIPESKIYTIYEGTDLKKFDIGGEKEDWKEKLGFRRDRFLAGIVAHLADHKGHIYLIESAKILKERGADMEILIIGEGELKDFLVSKTKELGVEDMVKFLGFRNDIPNLLKAIDLFVLSSHLEGLCTSLLDAMASKLPIVATRTGGIPEAVEDGVNGILVPPRDSSALADAIFNLYKNRNLLVEMGERGYERAKKLFSVERMVENTISLYNKLLEEKGLKTFRIEFGQKQK